MVIHDLDMFCTLFLPTEADAPLIVDTNAVLAGTVAFESFKAISGRNPQIVQPAGNFELPQLPSCNRGDICKSLHPHTL
jgi:hypothetical protein